MSTRRARIKAVTSLPPRRKNIDSADSAKSKVHVKDEAEKAIKSPRTPRGTKIQEGPDKNSPARKPSSPLISPRILSNTPKTHNTEHEPSLPTKVAKESAVVVPKISEKVSVITSTSTLNDSNVFRSPKSVGSPFRRSIASPLVHTKADIDVKRLNTPEKHKFKQNTTKPPEITNEHPTNIENNATSSATNEVRNDVPDDYNVPSVPESIPEDAVMDGIVPLQPIATAPKPIALLKNEIISENAEVLFDPIVPLPSPSKVRPKLRPVPRLAPLRRNSVQGSASESEDENRRALLNSAGTPAPMRQRHDSHTSHSTLHSLPNREVNRVRNDSICSTVSQATALHPVAASPHKEKHFTKSRRHEAARRSTAMRRRREAAPRDALTMYDLIFYNPTGNPIVPDQDELNLKAANAKEEKARIVAKEVDEDNPDDPPELDAAPVPQIKLGPNGEIMLDEQSLVIKQSDKRAVAHGVVHEGGWARGGPAGRYRRTPRTADWSDAETVRYYRALAALGTDFMLMEPLFPGRTRRDLKLKFKKEERVNAAQVDKALRTSSKWDAARLIEEFREEREAAASRARDDSERLQRGARDQRDRTRAAKELRVRQSRGSKVLEFSTLPGVIHRNEDIGLTADEIIRRHKKTKAEGKKRKPVGAEATPVTQANIAPKPQLATLTRINNTSSSQDRRAAAGADMASILKVDPKTQPKPPENLNNAPVVPSNIETGSLVVLTVNDPNSPSKKMLQTYIANGGGRLTPVALPTSFLNSVVTYMKKGTPKSTLSAGSSPHLTSPSSVASHDSRSCSTPSGIHMNGSPAKRQRHSSYTITQL